MAQQTNQQGDQQQDKSQIDHMGMQIGDQKRVIRKLMNGFVGCVRVVADKPGGVGEPKGVADITADKAGIIELFCPSMQRAVRIIEKTVAVTGERGQECGQQATGRRYESGNGWQIAPEQADHLTDRGIGQSKCQGKSCGHAQVIRDFRSDSDQLG